MAAWKCTKCCKMVEESEMKSHVCGFDHTLMPPALRARPGTQAGSNLTGQVAGAIELSRLRAEQWAWDEAREQHRKAAEVKDRIVTAPPGLIEAGQRVTRKAAEAAKVDNE